MPFIKVAEIPTRAELRVRVPEIEPKTFERELTFPDEETARAYYTSHLRVVSPCPDAISVRYRLQGKKVIVTVEIKGLPSKECINTLEDELRLAEMEFEHATGGRYRPEYWPLRVRAAEAIARRYAKEAPEEKVGGPAPTPEKPGGERRWLPR